MSSFFINYGDGRSGSAASISGVINSYATCIGTAGARIVTTALSVTAGDMVFLHQTTGAGATNCEMVQVAVVGSGQFTATLALANTYVAGAQAIKVPQYTSGAMGNIYPNAWDGSTGGICVLVANGTLTLGGISSINSKGFRGGARGASQHANGTQGEGTSGLGSLSVNAANANGGGAGTDVHDNFEGGGGGGGGNLAGSNGADNGNSEKGLGGAASGNASLTAFSIGGGGGGGAGSHQVNAGGGNGGSGGGGLIAFAPKLIIGGGINLGGGPGGDADSGQHGGGGGGGAGGSGLFGGNSVNLGSSLLTAAGGAGGQAWSGTTLPVGGAGGNGRFAVIAPLASAVSGSIGIGYTFTADNSFAQRAQGFII